MEQTDRKTEILIIALRLMAAMGRKQDGLFLEAAGRLEELDEENQKIKKEVQDAACHGV